MGILIGIFIIILITLYVIAYKTTHDAEQNFTQLPNPAREHDKALLAEVKRQAEEHNDQDTIRAVLNNTYNGPMPELKPDGTYTSIYATYLRFKIAGINHRKRIRDYVGKCRGYIQPEPKNKYDPNAIAIYAEDGHHLGYIPQAETQEVRDLGMQFQINVYCEIEEDYDYDDSRRFFVGHILIELPEKETPASRPQMRNIY